MSGQTPDENRAIRLLAIREWDRLLTEATKPNFRGTVAVEINSKDGRLSQPKLTRVQFGSSE